MVDFLDFSKEHVGSPYMHVMNSSIDHMSAMSRGVTSKLRTHYNNCTADFKVKVAMSSTHDVQDLVVN